MDHNKHDTSWNDVAGWYDRLVGEKGSDYHQSVIIPGVLTLLAPQKGEKILDLGCGQGVLSRKLAESGALVTGVDASKNLIKISQSRAQRNPNLHYVVADAAALDNFSHESFDAAASILSLQNMENMEAVIKESSRVLKKNGRLVIVINHPCFRIPRQSGWGFDEKRKLQYRRVDAYLTSLKIPIQMHPGHQPSKVTWSFHRPLSVYFEAFKAHGLVVISLEEWTSHRESLPGKTKRTEDRARAEIPLFLAITAKKI